MPRPLSSVPGPRPLPLVGNVEPLHGDPLAFMTGLAREHGDLARFRVLGQENVLVSDPDLIEQVLVGHRAATVKDPITAGLSDVLGNGLLTAEGEAWRANRRLVAPSFQPGHLAALGDTMVECAGRALDALPEGEVDLHPHTMALALDIAVRTLFGAVLDDTARVGPLVERLMEGFDRQTHSWRRLLPAWVPTASRRDARRIKAELRAVLDTIVARKRAAVAEGEQAPDLLSRLLAARDDAGRGMSDEQLHDELLTLFLAGHETTALTLAFAGWLLSAHPEAQARARAEVDGVLGGAAPTAADTRRLPFVDAVVQEAMRLYPPAWIVGRQATEDLVLGDVLVPAGTVLLASQWVVHRDPRWFAEPEAFRPGRWLTDPAPPRFAYFPFGGGPRVCVGNHFARMEAVLVLARTLQAVELGAVAGFAPALTPSVTLRPRDGVRVRVIRRGRERAAA